MKKFFFIILISFSLCQVVAQTRDTLTPEKKARYMIKQMDLPAARSISPNGFSRALGSITDMAAKRTPFLRPNEVRKGMADTAQVVYIYDKLRSGTFIYRSTDTTSLDDSSMVIRAGKRRFIREDNEIVRPEWFGAIGDGITDDHAAIQRCLDYIASGSKGGRVVFGPKTYLTSKTLKLKPFFDGTVNTYNITVQGAGRRVTFIKGTDNLIGNLLEMTQGSASYGGRQSHVSIRELALWPRGGDRGFFANYIADLMITDVYFKNAQIENLRLGVAEGKNLNYNTHITRCYFQGFRELKGGGHNSGCLVAEQNQFLYVDKMETDGGSYGIKIKYSANSLIQNCKIEGSKVCGIYIEGSYGGGHKIINNEIYNYSGVDGQHNFQSANYGIYIKGGTAAEANNLISGNSIHVDEKFPIRMGFTGLTNFATSEGYHTIIGQTSGATGYFFGVDSLKKMAIMPISGTFVSGETFVKKYGKDTQGKGVITEIIPTITYGLKMEVGFSANRITDNLFANQNTYGLYVASAGNLIEGNIVNGLTGIFTNTNNYISGNNFYCGTLPWVNEGNKSTFLNNFISGGNQPGIQNNIRGGLSTDILEVNKLLTVPHMPIYNDNSAAAQIPVGTLYRTPSGEVKIKY